MVFEASFGDVEEESFDNRDAEGSVQYLWGCVHVARAISWCCLWIGSVGRDGATVPCPFKWVLYESLSQIWMCLSVLSRPFSPSPGALTLDYSITELCTAAIHWLGQAVLHCCRCFWRISVSLSQWSTFPRPFRGRNSVSFSLLPCWNTATSHSFTLSPQTHYFNPSSLCNVIITLTIASERLKMKTHKTK